MTSSTAYANFKGVNKSPSSVYALGDKLTTLVVEAQEHQRREERALRMDHEKAALTFKVTTLNVIEGETLLTPARKQTTRTKSCMIMIGRRGSKARSPPLCQKGGF